MNCSSPAEVESGESLFRTVLDASYDAVIVTEVDLDNPTIIYANPSFCRMTGYRAEEVIGKTPKILQGLRTDPKVMAKLRQALEAGESYETHAVNYRKDGTPFHMQWRTSPVFDGRGHITHYMAVQRDVTDEIHLIKRLKEKAEIDGLTRLLTRGAGEKDVQSMLSRAAKSGDDVSLLLFDVDHFKQINDQHGHVTGDHVLRKIAQIIDGRTRGNDLAVRWGGEEFVCLLWATAMSGALQVAESIRAAIEAESMENIDSITISCGVAQWRSDESHTALFERADAKLYEAKSAGRNLVKS